MKNRAERLSRDSYKKYLGKAEDFARLMTAGLAGGSPNGAALAAIHCAISAVDALCVFHLGERSRGQDHHGAVALLGRVPVADVGKHVIQFHEIMAQKNAVEYEALEISRKTAESLVERASRLLTWVKSHLPAR